MIRSLLRSTLFPYTTLFRSPLKPQRLAGKATRDVERGGSGRKTAEWLASVNLPLPRSEEHTSELQSLTNLVCRLLLEKKIPEVLDRHRRVALLRVLEDSLDE